MRQRGAVQSIDTLGGKTYGGVEAKRECGGFKIVVNGLGHSHNAETFFVQLIGDGEAAVSTDGNKSVDVVIAEPLKHLIGTVNLRFASVGCLTTQRKGLPRLVVPRMVPPRCGISRTVEQ